MNVAPDTLSRVREICLSQPLAAEKTSHGLAHFHIEKGKGFAWYLPDHHGNGIYAIATKASGPEEQAMPVEADPELSYRPAHLAALGWVGMRLDTGPVDRDRVADRVAARGNLAASPRQRERYGR